MAEEVGPTKLGKLIVVLFIIGCFAGAAYQFRDTLFPSSANRSAKDIDLDEFRRQQDVQGSTAAPQPGSAAAGAPNAQQGGPEAPDSSAITTVKEYKYVPADKLPPVKGASAYKWDANEKIVNFPINVWIGWLPIVAANHGFAPNTESIFFKKYGFKVNLKLIDDPVTARDAYVSGDSHILWGTLDMMVLFSSELMKDSRTAPRIYQQVDWSSGGDGIVARNRIATVRDLKGKTIVYAQNSPSQYFVNNLLLNAGIQPSQVTHKYTATAFEAAAAFVADPSIDACVSWAPDIYKIPERVKGTRILTTTADANRLIADVWAARADFAKDHPDVIEGLVAGIFEGMRLLKDESHKGKSFAWMAEGYGMDLESVKGMINDAQGTGFGENKDFFLNANSPANFERSWKNITFVYKELGLLGTPVRFDEVMDFSVLQKLDQSKTFKDQEQVIKTTFVPSSYQKFSGEAPVLTQTIRINFFPNSANLYEAQRDEFGRSVENTLYDPNVPATLEKVARLSGQYERAVIAVIGHTDSSMKGKVPRTEVDKLSKARAEAVKTALVKKYNFSPDKFVVEGKAWDEPADAADANNHALNRRVEIAVYPPEEK